MDYTHLNRALVPHGISVSLSAPAVFQLTAHADPRRHAQALAALSEPGSEHAHVDTSTAAKYSDGDYVGRALSARLMELMQQLKVPMGLGAIGFVNDDINALVESTLPQQRVNKMAYLGPSKQADAAILAELFRSSMTY
jgi:hydroxyacid-oxoacid transhydrogenase